MLKAAKVLLVTGGAGFIGSNFILQYRAAYPEDILINLDNLTYSGNLANLKSIENDSKFFFVKGSITDKKLVRALIEGTYSASFPAPNRVVHFAAESHVDRSIEDATPFVETNVMGTQVLLDAIRDVWQDQDDVRFLHVSTDEVYGSIKSGFFTESTPLQPNSPYAASKAASDLLVRAYYKTYELPLLITRCSNNYGPYQFPEKLIPLMIHRITSRLPLPVYGAGKNVRDWLFVIDHCLAIMTVLENGRLGEVYNIGGNNEWQNIDIVRLICKLADERLGTKDSESLIQFVKDRPGHDFRYAIDASRMKKDLQWSPTVRFEAGIKLTLDWYLENEDWLQSVTTGAYQSYYEEMYKDRC